MKQIKQLQNLLGFISGNNKYLNNTDTIFDNYRSHLTKDIII